MRGALNMTRRHGGTVSQGCGGRWGEAGKKRANSITGQAHRPPCFPEPCEYWSMTSDESAALQLKQ